MTNLKCKKLISLNRNACTLLPFFPPPSLSCRPQPGEGGKVYAYSESFDTYRIDPKVRPCLYDSTSIHVFGVDMHKSCDCKIAYKLRRWSILQW